MYPHHKPVGENRLVILGDSCVFGVPGEKGPWPAQVQQRLNDIAGKGRFLVINAGIEGQSSVHCLMRLDRILTFDPDIVLVAVVANDLFIEDPANYVDTSGLAYATPWEVVGEYPRERDITNTLGGVARPMSLDDFFPYTYEDHLRRMVLKCRASGVIPILITSPCLLPADMSLAGADHFLKMHHPPFVAEGDRAAMRRLYEIYNHAVRCLAGDLKVVLIEAEDYIAQNHDHQRGEFFSDTCHPTVQGNRLLGKYVADALWELLGGKA
jgi:hypothetical protein